MTKHFFIELSHCDRIRVHLHLERGRVIDLVVQLEIWEGKWIPVVRYNYAHGIPHKDLMHADGLKTKEWFQGKKLEEIVNEAIDDLKQNWKSYLARCGYD